MNTTPKPVLDSPEVLKDALNRDVDNLLEMKKGRGELEMQRLIGKANAVDRGLRILIRAVNGNPHDADAAYCEVIEQVAVEAEQACNVERGIQLHEERLKGRKEGLDHVLYRVRAARA